MPWGRQNRGWLPRDPKHPYSGYRARTKLLTIRVSEEERAEIEELARKRGMSVAAFFFKLVEDAKKKR